MKECLQSFTFLPLRLTLKALSPLRLPAYKGSTFRGGFGAAFRELACVLRRGRCEDCLLRQQCPYSYVFETPVPSIASRMRKYPYAPHPFVLVPPLEDRRDYEPGVTFEASLTLIGRAVDYLPYFLLTVKEMGRRGIGRGRGKFELVDVRGPSGERVLAEDEVYCPRPLRWEEVLDPSPPRKVSLRFVTPLRVKYQERLCTELEFHVLIRGLLRRVSLLCFFHCGVVLDVDFRELIERAKGVETVGSDLRWHDWFRWSQRQRKKLKLGGLLGEISFQGDMEPFWPFLQLGQWVHVGKGTSFGLGKYEILKDEKDLSC